MIDLLLYTKGKYSGIIQNFGSFFKPANQIKTKKTLGYMGSNRSRIPPNTFKLKVLNFIIVQVKKHKNGKTMTVGELVADEQGGVTK